MFRSLLDLKFVFFQVMHRKIRALPLMAHLENMKSFVLRHRIMKQKALPRKISKLI